MLVLLACLAVAALVAVGIVAHGPEGFANIKDPYDRVPSAAAKCSLELSTKVKVAPSAVRVPSHVCVKHAAKKIGSLLGVVYLPKSSAEDFQLSDSHAVVLHCLARYSGDQLIGIELRFHPAERSLADCLVEALKTEFPNDLALILTQEA